MNSAIGYSEGAEVPEDKTPRTIDLHPWINIRHKLPEYMQVCIIHSTVGFVTMAQFGGGSPGKEVFVSDSVWHIADYWMPLPTFERNKIIDEYINYLKENLIGLDVIDEQFIEAFESLKNYEASIALIKTFGLIAPGKWPRKKHVTRPNYYWLKPEVLK